MGSPVLTTDFPAINAGGNVCDEFHKMAATNAKLRIWFEWAFDSLGNATAEFQALFRAIGVPVGMVGWFPYKIIPSGWLLCNGQAVSRVTYAALFTVIGTSHGVGDGSTTFNVPNLGGRFLFGFDASHQVGTTGGEAEHVLTADEMPAHGHEGLNGGNILSHPYVVGDALQVDQEQVGGEQGFSGENPTTSLVGGDMPHNNLPPYMAGLWLIRY